MSNLKKILISLPQSLLEEVDGLANKESRNRSEFIVEAMKQYVAETNKKVLREQMKKGYQEMAHINLYLAVENFEIENEAHAFLEKDLVEYE